MKAQISSTGFYASLIALIAVIGFGIVQLLQLLSITVYPMDEILIYGFSLAIAPPFLIAILALHYLKWDFFTIPTIIWVISMFLLSLLFFTFKKYSGSILGAIICHSAFNLGMIYCIFYLID